MNPINVLKNYYLLKQNLYKSNDELLNIQRKRTIAIIKTAYENSIYYRKIFNEINFHPNDLVSDFNNFKKLPILTKESLRQIDVKNFIATKSKNLNELIYHPTSGSTGIPLKIYKTPTDSLLNDLCHIRSYRFNGWKTFDKIVSIIGHVDYRNPNIFQKFRIMPIKYISIDQSISMIVDELKNNDFKILKAYSDDISIIAKFIIDNKIENIYPKIVSTGAALLDDVAKELIFKAFGVRPMDSYGSADAGQIAWQCKRFNYHINIDMVNVEVLNNNGKLNNHEPGEIVVTNLWNSAFPIIRFKLGDIITLEKSKCNCGCNFPLMKMIDGKTVDFIILPSGEPVTPHAPKQILSGVVEIKSYKIIQKSISKVQVNIVINSNYKNSIGTNIIKKMNKIFKNQINVDLRIVNSIPRSDRKFTTVESTIGQNFFKQK